MQIFEPDSYLKTFIIRGIDYKHSKLKAQTLWEEIGLLLNRIVEEHLDQYKAIRMLKLVIEFRDTLRQRHGKQVTVSTRSKPVQDTNCGEIIVDYYL